MTVVENKDNFHLYEKGGERVKKRIIVSVFTIVVSAAMIAGGTMAWFTELKIPEPKVFT